MAQLHQLHFSSQILLNKGLSFLFVMQSNIALSQLPHIIIFLLLLSKIRSARYRSQGRDHLVLLDHIPLDFVPYLIAEDLNRIIYSAFSPKRLLSKNNLHPLTDTSNIKHFELCERAQVRSDTFQWKHEGRLPGGSDT